MITSYTKSANAVQKTGNSPFCLLSVVVDKEMAFSLNVEIMVLISFSVVCILSHYKPFGSFKNLLINVFAWHLEGIKLIFNN